MTSNNPTAPLNLLIRCLLCWFCASAASSGCGQASPAGTTNVVASPPSVERWEGYLDQRVLVSLEIHSDQTHWSARVAVPALAGERVTVGLDRQPLPWPSGWHTTMSSEAWGKCPLHARRRGGEISGLVEIHGTTYELVLRRVPPSAPARPAVRWEPPRPVSYRVEQVAFRSGTTRIAGEVMTPRGRRRRQAVLLLAGGESADRDGNAFVGQGRQLYRCIGDYLARLGFVVLRTDDRGVGNSEGRRGAATLAELAGDAVAALDYLAGRPDVLAGPVTVLGYSEGAVVAPIVSANAPGAISSLVLLAPQAVVGATGNMEQLKRRAARTTKELVDLGAPAEILGEFRRNWEERLELDRIISALLFSGVPPAEIRARLVNTKRFEEQRIDVALEQVSSPRGVYQLLHDPGPFLRKVQVPTLAVYFGMDEIVPPDVSEPVLRAIAEGGNRDLTVRVFPDYDHGMRRPAPEDRMEWPPPPAVPAPDVLELLGTWLLRYSAGGE